MQVGIHATRTMEQCTHVWTLLGRISSPHLEELNRRRGGVDEHHAQAARRAHAGVGATPVSTRGASSSVELPEEQG